MPRWTPPNPALLTPDYGQIKKGILDAFQVASEQQKLEAFRHQQEELDALRADRIASARAKYHGDVRNESEQTDTSSGRVGSENARNLSAIRIAPVQTEATLADLSTKLALAPGDRTMRLADQESSIEALPDARTSKLNRAATDAASSDYALASVDDAGSAAIANAKLGRSKAEHGLATEDDREALDSAKLQDELLNAQTDTDLARVASKLKNALTQSQIDENKARSAFNLGTGRQTGTAPRDRTLSEIAMLDRSIDTASKRMLPSGMTVQAYMEQRDPSEPDTLNQDGEAAIQTIHQLHAEKDDTMRQALENRRSARAASRAQSLGVADTPVEIKLPGAAAASVYDAPAKGGNRTFNSVDEAQNAYEAGEIAIGDKIVIAGRSGTWK